MVSVQGPPPWELYVDGSANQRGSGVGLVLVLLEKITIEKSLRLNFSATNNVAEYEALLMGMVMVQKMGGKAVKVFSDSKLVVGQVRGDLEARDSRMQEYLCQVRSIQEKFEVFDLSHVPRSGNTHADSLATLATSSAQDLPRVVLVEDLYMHTSVHHGAPRIHQIKLGPSWMDSISLFLEKDVLLEEKSKANKVRRKAPRFWLSEDRKLYKCSFSSPYLLCMHPKHQNHFWRSCTKGFVGVIQEEDPCRIELLPKDISGQTCKKRCRNMSRNGINARGMHPIFTSLEGFSTLFLICGLLLNGV